VVVLVASSVVGVVVCNRSQMRTSKCTCLIFGVSIDLDPGYCGQKHIKGIFDGSKFKVICNIKLTISGWLPVLCSQFTDDNQLMMMMMMITVKITTVCVMSDTLCTVSQKNVLTLKRYSSKLYGSILTSFGINV